MPRLGRQTPRRPTLRCRGNVAKPPSDSRTGAALSTQPGEKLLLGCTCWGRFYRIREIAMRTNLTRQEMHGRFAQRVRAVYGMTVVEYLAARKNGELDQRPGSIELEVFSGEAAQV